MKPALPLLPTLPFVSDRVVPYPRDTGTSIVQNDQAPDAREPAVIRADERFPQGLE